MCGTEVVPDVVVREHVICKLEVAAVPDLLVEPSHQGFVLGNTHRSLLYCRS